MKSNRELPKFSSLSFIVGPWRSLVARLSGGQEVPSSNLGGPTIFHYTVGITSPGVKTRLPFSFRFLIPPIALLATIAWASSFDEGSPQGPDIVNFDKLAHFFVFGLLATLWFRSTPGPLQSNRRFALAFILTVLYGIVDEWIQHYNPLRSSDVLDIVADGAGAAAAILVYRSWGLYRRVLETRFLDVIQGKIDKDD